MECSFQRSTKLPAWTLINLWEHGGNYGLDKDMRSGVGMRSPIGHLENPKSSPPPTVLHTEAFKQALVGLGGECQGVICSKIFNWGHVYIHLQVNICYLRKMGCIQDRLSVKSQNKEYEGGLGERVGTAWFYFFIRFQIPKFGRQRISVR